MLIFVASSLEYALAKILLSRGQTKLLDRICFQNVGYMLSDQVYLIWPYLEI